ncbi:MAG: PAS domain S-box protein [Planctomycetia bacterium]|nr:PAS domain S-box protein [Planctomycetia bacterium]
MWIGEFLNKKKNGELYWESATISPILDNNNNITHFLAVKEDITKKKEIVGELMEREEKYRTLTQNLNVGVYRSTPGKNGRFIEVNPTFLKIFGFRSKNELERYKTVDFYSNPLERDRIENKLAAKGFLINEEAQLRKKDGSIFFASISSTSAKDELGNVIHNDGIVEDITERKEMMERILKERDRSQLYLDIAGVMFLALDRKGDIILANQKTCEIIGTTEKNLIGKNWFDNYLPKEIQLNTKDVFNILMNGNAKLGEFHENDILTASGEKRLIAWQNRTINDETGKILGIISSGLDITESKEDEKLRKQLYETSRNLAESLDIDIVLHRMSKQARALLKCSGVTVYMIEDDKKTLKPVVAYDPPYTKQVLATKIDIDKSYTGQAIKAKKGKIFNYHNNIKGAFHIKGTPKTDTDNIIVSPLEIDGEIIGALTLVRSKTPFTDKDLSIVNTFAVYGSTAIKNANSHKQILHEIEERKQAQALLKESHDRYESIFNGATDGIIYTSLDGNIISANSSIAELFSIKRKDLVGKNAIELAKSETSGATLKRFLEFINRILKGEEIRDYSIKTNGRELEFSSKKGKGKPDITIMVRDVTERNKARENVTLHQKNLQSLSNELAMAEEKARRRLAITLHDKLGQSLVLANLKNNELNKIVVKSEQKKIISEISGFLEDAINESRNITYELSPPVLYEMGLIPAINWKLDEIEKNNKIKTSSINRSKSYEVGKREQIILYRSINELLQNVLKHSKAKDVNITFRLLTNDYRITVSDNGIGFDLKTMRDKALSEKKFGLFSIMERIKYIGGSVEIDTKPRKGTKVVINMPIKKYKI